MEQRGRVPGAPPAALVTFTPPLSTSSLQVMTYALGSGADSTVTKKLACDSRGISYKIPDGDSTALGDAMAGYYELLSPMLTPCQTRWIVRRARA